MKQDISEDKKGGEIETSTLGKSLSQDYISAELTSLVYHNRKDGNYTNILTLIELIPVEQQPSPNFGSDKYPNVARLAVDENSNLLLIRVFLSVFDAVAIYEKSTGILPIFYNQQLYNVRCSKLLVEEPPGSFPLLISNEEKTYGAILPKRNTAFRVWSKIDVDKAWTAILTERHKSKITEITTEFLKRDLVLTPEHFGNIYLFGCNPYIRRISKQLVKNCNGLLVEIYPRAGKDILGCKLIVEEKREGNPGFFIEKVIESEIVVIDFPYEPHMLIIKLVSPEGSLLLDSNCAFLKGIQMGLGVGATTVNYSIEKKDGVRRLSVNKFSSESPTFIGSTRKDVAGYLKEKALARRPRELEKSGDFFFFPISSDSRGKAQEVVQRLLRTARERCIILDPYFGYEDLEYIFHIESISFPVKIISSAQYLRGYVTTPSKTKKKHFFSIINHLILACRKKRPTKALTNAHQLLSGIDQLNEKFSQQKIACKVLRGKSSPLHDRYIVIDDKIYLLGSSLNEFGNRTTTIIKVPEPREMLELAENWWASSEVPNLEEYTNSLANET